MAIFKDLFKKMDIAIFKLVDNLNSIGFWQQLLDRFRMMGETQQKILNHLLSIFAVLAPLLFFITLFVSTQKLHQAVEVKEQLLSTINNLSLIKGEYLNLERTKISRTLLTGQQEAEAMLKKLFENKNINSDKASLSNFNRDENAQGLVISNFKISFKNFTTTDLTNALSLLIEREKAVITSLSVRKDTKENTLEGTMDVAHYSKGMN